MADNILSVKIKQRYDTESNWSANNPVLLAGEAAYSSDRNGMYKIGDGTSTWSQLPYNNANAANTATKATQDESGNNIKSSYASSISISDHTITLKNKNGASLGSVIVPDNNTDTKVTQTVVTTGNAFYPLLLAPKGQTATATTTSYFNSNVTLNPSTNTISANISGKSAAATKATQDSAGQQINTTYIKGLSVSGRTITYTKGNGSTGKITTQDTTYGAATTSTNGLLSYSSNVATTSEIQTYLGY